MLNIICKFNSDEFRKLTDMKTLVIAIVACMLTLPGSASEYSVSNEKSDLRVSTISFSVLVYNGDTPLDGAKVSVIQNGKEISSGVTMRGKAQLYIENEEPFTIKVEAKGFNAVKKEIKNVTSGEKITIDVRK